AEVSFDPPQVLPTQISTGTAVYTLVSEAASGVPLTLIIREELTLLDGSVRREAPYSSDLVLYHTADGPARSRFRLLPSVTARRLPISSGRIEIVVKHFEDATLGGNVVGYAGGSVTNSGGDQLKVEPGSLFTETAIVLERRTASDLPLEAPSGAEIQGVIALIFDAAELEKPATFTLAMAAGERPQADDVGLLLQVIEVHGEWHYRVVAELEPLVDTGWRTKAIDSADLPWPGVRSPGPYVLVKLTAPVAFLRGHRRRAVGRMRQPRGIEEQRDHSLDLGPGRRFEPQVAVVAPLEHDRRCCEQAGGRYVELS
ncbi:MAG: hypothetical protein GY856_46765, partial [bacterium]|nr:hypothetical protein [bacterium]